jgi:acyl-coenzyme A thioesterase PaaI-like protein
MSNAAVQQFADRSEVLPSAERFATLEGPETGMLRVIGEAIHAGRRTGAAEGRLVDAKGKLHARGTTTCLIFDF